MIDKLFAGDPWLVLLVQGTTCLAVGLAASFVLWHRPAHAHRVLLTALLASVLMPGLYLSARHFGVGVLAPRTAPAVREIVKTEPLNTALLADMITTQDVYESTPSPRVESVAGVPAHPATTRRIPWGTATVACWLTATLVLLTRLALRFVLGLHLVRTADPVETEHVGHAIDEAKSRLGIEKSVRIRCSEKVHSPVIWCWVRKPVLLMQKTATNCPNSTDWVSVFCHELAHWRRRDHLSGLFAELLVAVLPWHPLLWWAKGRLLKLSEQACDDWVLATGHRGEDYAETLLGLAAQRQMAFLPTVIGREKTMNMRIRRIIKERCSNPRIGKRWAIAVSVTAVLASVGIALAQQAPVPRQPVESEPSRVQPEPSNRQAPPDPAQARRRKALDHMIDQLTAQIREKEAALREHSDQPAEERQVLQFEIELLREQAQQLERRRRSVEQPSAADQPQAPMPRVSSAARTTEAAPLAAPQPGVPMKVGPAQIVDYTDPTYGGKIRQLRKDDGHEHNFYYYRDVWNADGSRMLGIQSDLQQQNWRVCLYNGDGVFLKELFSITEYDWRLCWDRNNPDILYTWKGSDLYRFHVAEGKAELLKSFAPLGLKPNGPSCNQAGDRILVITSDGTFHSYHLPDMSDERTFQITVPPGCFVGWDKPHYTGYRNCIDTAYNNADSSQQAIVVYDDTGTVVHTFDAIGGGGHYDYSPDGKLAYFKLPAGGRGKPQTPFEIHVVNLDGSNDRVLFTVPRSQAHFSNLHLSWPGKVNDWFVAGFFPSAANPPAENPPSRTRVPPQAAAPADRARQAAGDVETPPTTTRRPQRPRAMAQSEQPAYEPPFDEILLLRLDGTTKYLARTGTVYSRAAGRGETGDMFWAQTLASPSADGKRICFNSSRSGTIDLCILFLDAAGSQ